MEEFFCPNCGATLNYQSGFDPSLGAWTCTECGQLLMDDDVYEGDVFEGVAWYCDNCGALLNKQYGFSDSYGTWTCTECGHTNGISEDEIIDGKHFTCPECGATLNNQSGFNAYDDWECSSCGTKLTHSYSDDDYSVVDVDKICCPNCNADLKEQWGFSEYNNDWTCSECGAHLHREYTFDEDDDDWICEYCGTKLHRYYGDHEYSIVDESDENSTGPSESKDAYTTHNNSQYESRERTTFNGCTTSAKEKSELRKLRIKAFITSKKKVPIGYDTKQLVGENFREVEIRLHNQAFKNIQNKSNKDVYTNSIFKDGEVESVSINGTTNFSSQEMFPYDSEIIVNYHEKREIKSPYSYRNLRKKNYMDVQEMFSDLGFTNISLCPIGDLTTGWITKDGSVESVKINGETGYKKDAIFKYDVSIEIGYHTFKNRR